MARIKRYNSETGQWEYCNTGGMPIKGIDYLTKADYDTMRADIDAYLERNKESVGVTVSGNQTGDDIIGAIVRIVDEDGSVLEEKVWNGIELVFRLEAGAVYHVEVDASEQRFSNYASETFTAVKGGARTVTAEVYAEKVNVSVEGIDSGFTVTVKGEYTPCEYIESSGSQYIDTGFKPDNNTRVVMDFEMTSTPSASSTIFGARYSSSSIMYNFMWHASGYFRSDYNKSASQQWAVTATGRRTVDKDKETTTVDGVSNSYTNASFASSHNLYLCALNNAGSVTWQASVRIYSCQIYDNGTLVRDYIPVMDSSGVYGLYDKVNGVFYSSATSTAFTGKAFDVDGLPSGYVECDYVESDGSQYVNTGFMPNNNTKVEIGIMSSQSTGSNVWLFGSQDSWGNNGYAVSTYTAEFGNFTTTSGITLHDGIKHDVVFDKGALSSDGVSLWSATGTFQTNYNMAIAAINSAGTFNGFVGKVYYCKIYDNGTLVRDYVPCKSDEGVFGLYDKVDGLFYASATSTGLTGAVKAKTFLILTETSGSCLVPYGTVYSVSATAVDGYASPSSQTFTASSVSRDVVMTYEENLLGVFIEDVDGKLWETDSWDGSVTANGVAVCTENCRFVIGLIVHGPNYWSNTYALVTGIVSTTDINVASTDYRGKENTQAILATHPDDTLIASLMSYNYKFPNGQSGYLGSAGEWCAVCDNYSEIHAAYSLLGLSFYIEESRYWTSTQYSETIAWFCEPQDQVYAIDKRIASTYSMPFTTLKRDTN